MAKIKVGGTFLHLVWVAFILVSTLIQPGDTDGGKLRSVTFNPVRICEQQQQQHRLCQFYTDS